MELMTREYSGYVNEPLPLKFLIGVSVLVLGVDALFDWTSDRPIRPSGIATFAVTHLGMRWLFQKFWRHRAYLTIRENEIDYRDDWGRLKTLDMNTATGIAWCGDNIGVRTDGEVVSVNLEGLNEAEQKEVSEYVKQFIANHVSPVAV